MSDESFIAVVRPGTTEQNGSGKGPRPRRKSERARKGDLRFSIREGDFFFLIRIRFYGVLRTDQFKKLVRASKFQFLLDAVLRPGSVDGCLCGVERAVINAAYHWNFKMKSGILLVHLD